MPSGRFVKIIFLFILLYFLVIFWLSGQTFTEQGSIIIPVSSSASAWGDLDNDGDLDIILSGNPSPTAYISKIYRNNINVFSDTINANLVGLAQGSVALADYNKDNLVDILVTGIKKSSSLVTKLYRNNGGGSFSDQTGITLPAIRYGTAIWGDIDNDGDQDIFISGTSNSGLISKIFSNNNDGTFSERFDSDFTPMFYCKAAFGDFNNDHYIDLIVTGFSDLSGKVALTTVYKNDGSGVFTPLIDTGLSNLGKGTVAWGDYNNDGYQDLLISGITSNGQTRTEVYKNNGNETFTKLNLSLTGVFSSSTAWGDLDNDGFLDIFVAGATDAMGSVIIAKVYRYSGNDNFQEVSLGWPGISNGCVSMGDFNKDNKLDVLYSGYAGSTVITKLYLNTTIASNSVPGAPTGLAATPSGTLLTLSWSPVINDNTPSKGLTYNVRFGKTSGNGDIIPPVSSGSGFRKIPSVGNTGHANSMIIKDIYAGYYYWSVQTIDNSYVGSAFSVQQYYSVDSVQANQLSASIIDGTSIKLKWKRGNGRRCVVFCRMGDGNYSRPAHLKTYIGDNVFGNGDQIGSTGWFCVYNGSTDSTVLKGLAYGKTYVVHVVEYVGNSGTEKYFRELRSDNIGSFGSGYFTEQSDISLSGVENGSSSWADYNRDGYLDLLISGRSLEAGKNITRIYQNNGDGSFSSLPETTLPGLFRGEAKWGDYNNDGYPDIVLTGIITGYSSATQVYKNNGNGSFSLQSFVLPALQDASAAWGDYDLDGDLDLLISGYQSFTLITKLYRNEGGSFNDTGISFKGTEYAAISWADFDRNGYPDILLSGSLMTSPDYLNVIYFNSGNNSFSEVNVNVLNYRTTSVITADFDKDGDIDIIANAQNATSFYLNDGSGVFQKSTFNLPETSGETEICDINNDGFLDLVFSGSETYASNSKLFINNGPPMYYYTEQIKTFSTRANSGSVAAGDYNNDGNLDILITGRNVSSTYSKVFSNNTYTRTGTFPANRKPSSPSGLTSRNEPNKVILNWNPVTGDETAPETMSYNLRYKQSGDTFWKAAPMSSGTGLRLIPSPGNLFLNQSFTFHNLPEGFYYWYVQAIDQGFKGSSWSSISSFGVKNLQAFFSSDEVCLGFPTSFTDQSVGAISSWKWDFNDGTFASDQNPVHSYTQSGTFNVKLVITDTQGTKDSLVQAVVVKPKPLTGFTASSVCQGIPVNATNTTDNNGLTVTSWSWDFGDTDPGNTSSLQQPAPHPYLNAADYTIKLKAVASNGCADSVSQDVSVGSYPVAAVTSSTDLTFCKGDSVTLTVPFVSNYTYTWKTSGINLTGATDNIYKAESSGNYTVEIVNPKGNCISTSPSIIVNALNAPSPPLITYEGSLQYCQGDSLTLSVSQISGYTYEWKNDGGTVGTNKNSFAAKSSGLYSVSLTNSSACKTNSLNTVNVIVDPRPVVPTVSINGQTSFCEGQNVTLTVPGNSSYTYHWQNNGSGITGATTNTYTAERSGTYSLKILNENGCQSKTEVVSIIVSESPASPSISYNGPQVFCQGDSILLGVPNTSGNSYSWKLNGGTVGLDKSSFYAKASGEYSLVVSNLSGCIASSVNKITVTVNPKPNLPVISTSGVTTFCQGSSVNLSVPDVTGNLYAWRNENGIISGITTNSYTASASGSYQTDISNSYGCAVTTSAVKVTVKPSPIKPTFDKPNYTKGICPGEEPIRLSAEQSVPGYSYTWYRNGLRQHYDTLSHIEFFESGNYRLAADLGGCIAESDLFTAEFPEGLPKPVIYAQGPTFWYLACSNTEAAKYRWYYNGKAIDGADKYFYLANYTLGNYLVSIANKDGCYTRSDIITIPPGYTGTDDVEPFEGIKVYPNPSSGLFTIEMNNNIFGKLSIEIISPDGRKIRRSEIEKTRQHLLYQMDLRGQPEGMYIINLILNKFNTTRKLLID